SSARTATLSLTDSVTGAVLTKWTSGEIAPGGFATVQEAELEIATGWQPVQAQTYIGVALDVGSFEGALRHLVTNPNAGGLADLTARCRVPLTIVDTVAPSEVAMVAPIYPVAP